MKQQRKEQKCGGKIADRVFLNFLKPLEYQGVGGVGGRKPGGSWGRARVKPGKLLSNLPHYDTLTQKLSFSQPAKNILSERVSDRK